MRVCVIHVEFPEPDTNSGGVRLFEILHQLVLNGHQVTCFAQRENDARYRHSLEEIGVRCVSDDRGAMSCSPEGLYSFREKHQFDAAVFIQYPMYVLYSSLFRNAFPECRLVLDIGDLHFIRCGREAELFGGQALSEQAARVRHDEILALRDADSVWVLTDYEHEILRDLDLPGSLHMVENLHRIEPDVPGWEKREGVVFVGGYRHSPNVDAVRYLMSDVYPILQKDLPGIPVSIVGSYPPDDFKEYERQFPDVHVVGFVDDLRALLKSQRVAIAPLRFGAGLKGKIGEYICCGLPCVTSSIGAEGMKITNGREALIADNPEDFAKGIVRLYSDRALWESMSAAGMEYIRANLSVEVITPHVLEALEEIFGHPPRPRPASDPVQREIDDLMAVGSVLLLRLQHPNGTMRHLCRILWTALWGSVVGRNAAFRNLARRQFAGLMRGLTIVVANKLSRKAKM